jgi:hypothetical protein
LKKVWKKNTVQKILKAENGRIGKDKESMTEKRNQRELMWFQTGVSELVSLAGLDGEAPVVVSDVGVYDGA